MQHLKTYPNLSSQITFMFTTLELDKSATILINTNTTAPPPTTTVY